MTRESKNFHPKASATLPNIPLELLHDYVSNVMIRDDARCWKYQRSDYLTLNQQYIGMSDLGVKRLLRKRPLRKKFCGKSPQQIKRPHINFM